MLLPGEPAFYHCVSRVRGQEMLLTDDEKQRLHELMRRVSGFSGVEIKTYCLMNNHFHMIVKVPLRREVDDTELVARMRILYGDAKTEDKLATWELWTKKGVAFKVEAAKAALRKRMFNLSDYFKTMKERYAKDYNRRSDCYGAFWSERFKCALLESERGILTTVGVYSDLNPVRAGVVKKAEDYKYSGFGAASRGDKAALEGIRDLLFPTPRSFAKRPCVEAAFAEYKKILAEKLPDMGKKKVPGTKKEVGEWLKEAPGTGEKRRKKQNFLAGAAIGSLKFAGKLILFIISAPGDMRHRGFGECPRPWAGDGDSYYRASRVNKRRRSY